MTELGGSKGKSVQYTSADRDRDIWPALRGKGDIEHIEEHADLQTTDISQLFSSE